MSTVKDKIFEKTAVINYIESQIIDLNRALYNRKANLLQTCYGFEMQEIPASQLYNRTYQDNTFVYEDKVFLDIDEALDFAKNEIGRAMSK